MIADLHTHSTASDGQYAPADLVALAKDRGIEVLAVTDHDTIDGVPEAIETGERLNIRVLRGVEFSADDHLYLHILGYNFAPERLSGFLNRLQKRRDDRKLMIHDYLRNKGAEVDLREVEKLAKGSLVGRPHFAAALFNAGLVKTRNEAYTRYLDTPEFHSIDTGRPSAEACVKTLKEAGAMVSLAHPYQIVLKNESLEELVRRLCGYGLDAIECYYTKHTPEQRNEYLRLADHFHLHVTGGSDFHGEETKPDYPLAGLDLNLDWLLN